MLLVQVKFHKTSYLEGLLRKKLVKSGSNSSWKPFSLKTTLQKKCVTQSSNTVQSVARDSSDLRLFWFQGQAIACICPVSRLTLAWSVASRAFQGQVITYHCNNLPDPRPPPYLHSYLGSSDCLKLCSRLLESCLSPFHFCLLCSGDHFSSHFCRFDESSSFSLFGMDYLQTMLTPALSTS